MGTLSLPSDQDELFVTLHVQMEALLAKACLASATTWRALTSSCRCVTPMEAWLSLSCLTPLKGGKKDKAFAERFSVLGVSLDASEVLTKCSVIVENTEGRKAQLLEQIDEIISTGHLPPAAALVLAGRLSFASSQFSADLRRLRCGTSEGVRVSPVHEVHYPRR